MPMVNNYILSAKKRTALWSLKCPIFKLRIIQNQAQHSHFVFPLKQKFWGSLFLWDSSFMSWRHGMLNPINMCQESWFLGNKCFASSHMVLISISERLYRKGLSFDSIYRVKSHTFAFLCSPLGLSVLPPLCISLSSLLLCFSSSTQM